MMVGAVCSLVDLQGAFQGLAGFGQIPEVVQNDAEVVQRACDLVIASAVNRLLNRNSTFVSPTGGGQIPHLSQDVAEAGQGAGDVGVVGAEGLLEDAKGAL